MSKYSDLIKGKCKKCGDNLYGIHNPIFGHEIDEWECRTCKVHINRPMDLHQPTILTTGKDYDKYYGKGSAYYKRRVKEKGGWMDLGSLLKRLLAR